MDIIRHSEVADTLPLPRVEPPEGEVMSAAIPDVTTPRERTVERFRQLNERIVGHLLYASTGLSATRENLRYERVVEEAEACGKFLTALAERPSQRSKALTSFFRRLIPRV